MGLLRSLAAGGADETGTLRAGQASKRRLLLYAIQRRIETAHPALFESGAFARNWATLARALRTDPIAVEPVLLHPPIGAWGMQLLRRLHEATEIDESDVDDTGYFGGLVAVALLRSGSTGEARVRIRTDGTVILPGLGRFIAAGPARWITADVRPGASGLSLADEGGKFAVAEHHDARWQQLRQLSSTSGGCRIALLVEDVDPYRALDQLPADDRLTDDEVAHWQMTLDDAWDLLVRHHPQRAAAIASDVSSVTPLRSADRAPQLSASSGYSFGGVALTNPHNGPGLAEALVHEHQHIKLWALLDLVPLIDLLDDRMHYAPWRMDARPARGLFQGAYAYLGLVQFWDVERRLREGAASRIAHFTFARWREAVRIVLRALFESGTLTGVGNTFVAGMQEALAPLLAAPVPALPAELAEEEERETWITWRLRHLRVDAGELRHLIHAWRDGARCALDTAIPAEPIPGQRSWRTSGRQRLRRERLAATDHSELSRRPARTSRLGEADLAYVCGDYATAAQRYGESVHTTVGTVDAWTGLALAHQRLATAGALALGTRPEVVRALQEALGPEDSPSPEKLAEWLSAGLDAGRLDH